MMRHEEAVAALAALGHDTRLAVYRLLVVAGRAGLAAGEIARRLETAPATLSHHLAALGQAGLVLPRRQGRSLIYAANFDRMGVLLSFLGDQCCAATGESCSPAELDAMSDKVYNVLFLCTANSARSILAEAILNNLGGGRFRAFSAGSTPGGQVNPYALRLLDSLKIPHEGARSKSWDEFGAAGAPEMDFVFTVCGNAAAETCPVWPGQPMTAHWGVEDPAAVTGDDLARLNAFREAYIQLERRIRIFTSLRLDALDRMSLRGKLVAIGQDQPVTV